MSAYFRIIDRISYGRLNRFSRLNEDVVPRRIAITDARGHSCRVLTNEYPDLTVSSMKLSVSIMPSHTKMRPRNSQTMSVFESFKTLPTESTSLSKDVNFVAILV